MSLESGGVTLLTFASQPAFGQLPPIPPATDAAWVYPQDDRHATSNGQVPLHSLLISRLHLSRLLAVQNHPVSCTCLAETIENR